RRVTDRTTETGQGIAEQRRVTTGLCDRFASVLQDTALEMTQSPRDFVVTMFRLRGLCRRLFLVAANRSGEHRRCGCRVGTTRQGDRRGVLRVGRDLHETSARGKVLLQVRANEIGTGRQIAEREDAVSPRNG